jgi:ABC-2 type transport system permease protein
MSRIWLIAKREFNYNIRRPSFLFTAFGTPLLIFGIWAITFLIGSGSGGSQDQTNSFGYVDNAAILADANYTDIIDDEDPDKGAYVFMPFADADSAALALDAGDIDAYYVIPTDYEMGALVERVSYEDITVDVDFALSGFLAQQYGVQVGVGPQLVPRLAEPISNMNVTLLDSGRRYEGELPVVLFLLPLGLGIIFFLAAQSTSQFLMTGLVEEKQNRIIEILVTTVKPRELLIGKVIGLGLLGLLQFTVWVVLLLVIYYVPMLAEFVTFDMPYDLIFVGFIYFSLSYFVLASGMAAVGVLVGSEQQSNMFAMLFMVPYYFVPIFTMSSLLEAPNSAYATFISIFPLTSPLPMTLRLGVGFVPPWQILLGIVLLVITVIVVAWFAARLFHWGLLLYGKKITPMMVLRVMFGLGEKSPTPNGEVR